MKQFPALRNQRKIKTDFQKKPKALHESLEKALQTKTKILHCLSSIKSSLNKIINYDLQLFDSRKNESLSILKLNQSLATIPLSLVEAEEIFFAVALFFN